MLFLVEPGIPGAGHAQMRGAKALDRASREILFDNSGTDIGRAGYRSGISEPLPDEPHHGCDRSEERPSPSAEILRRELGTQMFLDVLVQLRRGEVGDVAVPLVAKEAR